MAQQQTFKIDQAATFSGIALLSVEPKCVFGTDQQDRTGDGVPKWEAQLVAGFRAFGNRTNNEVIKVGLTSHDNPGNGIPPYSPVELIDFEVGVMPKTNRNQEIVGVQVWYRAREIRSTASTKHQRSGGE